MLHIHTFDARAGGNVIYKALSHPLAAEAIARLYAKLGAIGGAVALYDPDGIAEALFALYPLRVCGLYVHDVLAVGHARAGMAAWPLTELADADASCVLVAAFDAGRIAERIAPFVPRDAAVFTLDEARLPGELLTNPGRGLDRLNYATNFVFFRDQDGLSTRLVSANYWAGYGARGVRLWLRLFDADGTALATWQESVPAGPGGIRDRQPGGARALRAGAVRRPVVRPRHRRDRARRGEIRIGHL